MGDLSNLHSGSSGNVDAIHEKNSQDGYIEQDITSEYNGFQNFTMGNFDKTKPLYLRVEWTNETAGRIPIDDVMNFANQDDGSNFADVTMNFICNVDANSTAALVFLWTNDWSVGDDIGCVPDGIFDYRKIILYQH